MNAGSRWKRTTAAVLVAALAAACGGGKEDSGNGVDGPFGTVQPSREEAARFLTQSTFGPTAAEIESLSQRNLSNWVNEQFAVPQTLHRQTLNQVSADLAATGDRVSQTDFFNSFWAQAIGGQDQLRQRAAFALSQIFVISFTDPTLANQPRGVASYYDMLGEHAFGNYRNLLEAVTLHPMMGIYLTHMRNQKEDAETGRVPDLNYAREITQLFTIGQYKLNLDGTVVRDGAGRPVEAYNGDDLMGLSKVFTGWSWYAGPNLGDRTRQRFFGNNPHLERDWRPMQAYNRHTSNTDFHSISEKRFLGTVIPAQTTPDTEGDLKIALDTLFNHPNVGPFIGKQLIQRLVTSNPSPAYVSRVATAFNNNGAGVRGDMKAVWRTILLDPEARQANLSDPAYGKVREPVVRLANFLRAFNASSTSRLYTGIGNTDNPGNSLNQTPMFASSVFNFFRPGFVPTSKVISDAGLVVPELQITHDVSVAGYMNYMLSWVPINAGRDIQQNYSAELALASAPAALVDRMNLLLFAGQMPGALRTQLVAAVTSRPIPAETKNAGGAVTNQEAIDTAKRARVYIAVYLSMSSPDYLIQK